MRIEKAQMTVYAIVWTNVGIGTFDLRLKAEVFKHRILVGVKLCSLLLDPQRPPLSHSVPFLSAPNAYRIYYLDFFFAHIFRFLMSEGKLLSLFQLTICIHIFIIRIRVWNGNIDKAKTTRHYQQLGTGSSRHN